MLMTASPLASVVTDVLPMKVWPSPKPVPSQEVFEKNSIRNCLFGLLLKLAWSCVAARGNHRSQ